ncbi:lysophospholipase [Deinococcus sp. PESE-13]
MREQPWSIPGTPVTGYVWAAESPRAAVLLTHGLGEYARRYVDHFGALIPHLVQAGYTVYAYDQRGHGNSPGERGLVDTAPLLEDHFRAREALRGQPLPVYTFGHSLGGLITAASAARDPRGLSGVILSSPALLIGEGQPQLTKTLAPLLARVAPRLPVSELSSDALSRHSDEVRAYQEDENIYHGKVTAQTAWTMLRLSGELWPAYERWQLPTLVVHGDQDQLADVKGSQRFTATIPAADKTLRVFEGGYHELLNDEPSDEVRQLILDWLAAHTTG